MRGTRRFIARANPSTVTLSRFGENIAKYSCVCARSRIHAAGVCSSFQPSVPSLARRLARAEPPSRFRAGDRYLFIYRGNSPRIEVDSWIFRRSTGASAAQPSYPPRHFPSSPGKNGINFFRPTRTLPRSEAPPNSKFR